MNYWPLSVILNSPLLPAVYAVEVQNIYMLQISPHAYHACAEVAKQIKPIDTHLVVIQSTDGPARFMYGAPPTDEEFSRLERAGVIQDINGFMYVIMEGLQ